MKDEEDFRRCTLLIDGVNERDYTSPQAVIDSLLKDLGNDFKGI